MPAMTARRAFLEWRRPSWPGLIIAAAFMAVVALALGWDLRSREARRVRSVVDAASTALTPPPGEAELQRIVRIAGLAKLLAPDIVVAPDLGGPEIQGRETVAGLAAQLSGAAGIRTVMVRDATVTFDDTKTRATVAARLDVATAARPEPREDDAEPVTLELIKVDGAWLIRKAVREPIVSR